MAGKDSPGRGRRWYDERGDQSTERRAGIEQVKRLNRLLFWSFAALGLFVVFISARLLQPWVFPVVSDYEVVRVERIGDSLRLWGNFTKERDCQFVALSYIGVDQRGDHAMFAYRFLTSDGARQIPAMKSAGVGYSEWGPIELNLPPAWRGQIDVISLHRCWSIWPVETHLATFTVK